MKTNSRILVVAAAVALAAGAAVAQSKPGTAPAAVPDSVFASLRARFGKPAGTTREEMLANYRKQMAELIEAGAQAEKDYPQAGNLYLVRETMLRAATTLLMQEPGEAATARVREIADRIMKSQAPADAKFRTDSLLLQLKVMAPGAPRRKPEEIEKDLGAYTARYAKTPFEARALVHGAVVATHAGLEKLGDEYVKAVQAQHKDDKEAQTLLRQAGLATTIGQPFQADLTRLDGKKLTLPDDLKGKVVVVDFWATWCGPCVATMPHMKTAYAQYKDKGVEFVGISLDTKRENLERFIKDNQIGWIITFSGQGWKDETAQEYGITSIPAVWVVGKDGKVVSTNARNSLEAVLDKALKN